MANTFNVGDLAKVTAALVGLDIVLGNMVSKDLAAEYKGGRGGTIRVPVPGALPSQTKLASDKTTPLTDNEITEQTISVDLTTHAYSSVLLSEADLNLS